MAELFIDLVFFYSANPSILPPGSPCAHQSKQTRLWNMDDGQPRKRSRFDQKEPDSRRTSRFDRQSPSRQQEERRSRSPVNRQRDSVASPVKSPSSDAAAQAGISNYLVRHELCLPSTAAAAARINAQIQAKKGIQHVDVPPIRTVRITSLSSTSRIDLSSSPRTWLHHPRLRQRPQRSRPTIPSAMKSTSRMATTSKTSRSTTCGIATH